MRCDLKLTAVRGSVRADCEAPRGIFFREAREIALRSNLEAAAIITIAIAAIVVAIVSVAIATPLRTITVVALIGRITIVAVWVIPPAYPSTGITVSIAAECSAPIPIPIAARNIAGIVVATIIALRAGRR